jgi:DNA (cytosine-5)-methyltransferase 1
MRRPIAIDLFAGAGGMSLGFEQAGFDIVAAVEIDPVHGATHKYNFPNCEVLPRSVEGLTGEEIRKIANVEGIEIDCVFGGAPCQGFSLIGHRILDDPRNRLVGEFVRIVSELKAKSFVFENVKGLTVGGHKKFLQELAFAFEGAGYDVRLPWQVLNAAHFGVPQNRERLFLVGVKRGYELPAYPDKTTSPAGSKRNAADLSVGPSIADALGDLPNVDDFEELRTSDTVKLKRLNAHSDYVSELRCVKDDAWHYSYKRSWNPYLLTSSARTEHSQISRRRFLETPHGQTEPISRFYRLSDTGISNTLRAGTDGARGAFTSPRPIHFKFPRCVTVREMARLHGFPDWFRFNVTKWHGARQIGNAVPPPLARAVAKQILTALCIEPSIPESVIELGDENLLKFDMSEAAAHFGIQAPRQRRDRKSGNIKRKQTDIEQDRLNAQRMLAYG